MACLFIAAGEFAFSADAALHTWMCFLKFHHFLRLIPHQMHFFFFSLSVGVDMGSPELRQLIDLVHQIQTSLLALLSTFWSFFGVSPIGAVFSPRSGPCDRLRSIMFRGVSLLTWASSGT